MRIILRLLLVTSCFMLLGSTAQAWHCRGYSGYGTAGTYSSFGFRPAVGFNTLSFAPTATAFTTADLALVPSSTFLVGPSVVTSGFGTQMTLNAFAQGGANQFSDLNRLIQTMAALQSFCQSSGGGSSNISSRLSNIDQRLTSIDQRLSRIEEKMGIKPLPPKDGGEVGIPDELLKELQSYLKDPTPEKRLEIQKSLEKIKKK